MNQSQNNEQPMRRAHLGWFIATWLVMVAIAAFSSFVILYVAMWGSIDSASGSLGTRYLLSVVAAISAFAIIGTFMHRSLRHNALWPKIIILLALLWLLVRAVAL